MSNTSIDKDYEQLQQKISDFREECYKELAGETIVPEQEIPKTPPVLPQLQLDIDYDQFKKFALKLTDIILEAQPELKEQMERVTRLFDILPAKSFFDAAIKINTHYFESISEENNVDVWIMPFIIENTVRPYLQKAADEIDADLKEIKSPKQCTACGEPPRIATINKDGQKLIMCARCYYKWQENKINCPHCGTYNHEDITILQVEEDDSGEIYGCKKCNGYVKVLKTRDMLRVPNLDMLDIKTIHFDYVAQDQGYGFAEEKDDEVN